MNNQFRSIAETSPENGRKGGRPRIPLESIACTCGAEQGLRRGCHTRKCRRSVTAYQREYRAWKRRNGANP